MENLEIDSASVGLVHLVLTPDYSMQNQAEFFPRVVDVAKWIVLESTYVVDEVHLLHQTGT